MIKLKDILLEVLETDIETVNVGKQGDWVVKAKTQAGEEYILKAAKFPKLYNINSARDVSDSRLKELGYKEYNVIPETRKAVVATSDFIIRVKSQFGDKIVPQKEFHEFIKREPTIDVSKQSSAYVRQIIKPEEKIITRVKKGKPASFKFIATWGESQPVAEDDILIVNDSEVYRIARSEFDQTYNKIQ